MSHKNAHGTPINIVSRKHSVISGLLVCQVIDEFQNGPLQNDDQSYEEESMAAEIWSLNTLFTTPLLTGA